MLVGHFPVSFGWRSTWILCLFLNWVIYLYQIKTDFNIFKCNSSVIYMICKYFFFLIFETEWAKLASNFPSSSLCSFLLKAGITDCCCLFLLPSGVLLICTSLTWLHFVICPIPTPYSPWSSVYLTLVQTSRLHPWSSCILLQPPFSRARSQILSSRSFHLMA